MAKGKFVEGYNQLGDGRNIWMIQANDPGDDSGWHWDRMLDDEPEASEWGGEDWITSSPSRKRINQEFRPGDIAFCYQGEPNRQLMGVARICEPLDDEAEPATMYMDWWDRVPPVPWNTLQNDPVLRHCEKVVVKVGTVFRVNEAEAKRLVQLIEPDEDLCAKLRAELRVPESWLETKGQPPKAIDLMESPGRTDATVSRVIRDSELSKKAKREAKYECAMCGYSVVRGDGRAYAETHHLRPLGKPHDGPDTPGNLLVLCPTCHAEFDLGAMSVDPGTGKICHVDKQNYQHKTKPARPLRRENLEFLRYHHETVFGR